MKKMWFYEIQILSIATNFLFKVRWRQVVELEIEGG